MEFIFPGHKSLGLRRAGTVRGCPVAIAINEQVPTCEAIVFGDGAMLCSVLNPRLCHTVLFQERARLFVKAFDIFQQCGHVAPQLKPFTFELDVPDRLLAAEPQRRAVSTKKVLDARAVT